MAPLDGIEIVVNPHLSGCKRGVIEGRRAYVSPAFADLLKNAKTQTELVALLESLQVVNIGLPQHDAQWHVDDFQIKMAQMEDAFRSLSKLPR